MLVKICSASALIVGLMVVSIAEAQRRPSSKLPGKPATNAATKLFANANRNSPRESEQLDPRCPDRHGRYPTGQCDAYIECRNGTAEEKLCPDGLLFNPATQNNIFQFPCSYPIDVDCVGREALQPAQETEECPHQFGYYRVGDDNNCGQFKNCVDGRGFIFDCPDGLAFNQATYRCDWADQVEDCNAEAYLGFTCPNRNINPADFGLGEQEYTYHRNPNDCQKYFLCINGRPRKLSCGENLAFNELTNECDDLENVPGCDVVPEARIDIRSQTPAPVVKPVAKPSKGSRKNNRRNKN